MTELLPIIIDLLKRPETHKVLSTVTPDGKPHSIICASLVVTDPSTIVVGEVYMFKTGVNLMNNRNVEFLVWSGANAYSIQATVKSRMEEGPEMEKMTKSLAKTNLVPVAVWEFKVDSAFDEGITAHAGTQVC